jgi:hypothetical protein
MVKKEVERIKENKEKKKKKKKKKKKRSDKRRVRRSGNAIGKIMSSFIGTPSNGNWPKKDEAIEDEVQSAHQRVEKKVKVPIYRWEWEDKSNPIHS